MSELTLEDVMNGKKVKTVDELTKVALELADFLLNIAAEAKKAKEGKDERKIK